MSVALPNVTKANHPGIGRASGTELSDDTRATRSTRTYDTTLLDGFWSGRNSSCATTVGIPSRLFPAHTSG